MSTLRNMRTALRCQQIRLLSLDCERGCRGMLCGTRRARDRDCVIASRGTMRPAVAVVPSTCCLQQHSSEQEEAQHCVGEASFSLARYGKIERKSKSEHGQTEGVKESHGGARRSQS